MIAGFETIHIKNRKWCMLSSWAEQTLFWMKNCYGRRVNLRGSRRNERSWVRPWNCWCARKPAKASCAITEAGFGKAISSECVETGVIVAEVLQGLKRDIPRIERYLSQWEMLEPGGFFTYREAAAISRLARARGISLSTIDTLIAAIAMEKGASLFSLDKDFSRIARITSLRLHSLPDLTS